MKKFILKKFILNFHREEDAATAVEYVVMLALIATACMQAIILNGNEVLQWYEGIDTDMGAAINNN